MDFFLIWSNIFPIILRIRNHFIPLLEHLADLSWENNLTFCTQNYKEKYGKTFSFKSGFFNLNDEIKLKRETES
jgi:hypothetical protein